MHVSTESTALDFTEVAAPPEARRPEGRPRFGRLDRVGAWLAACQGRPVPRLERTRVVVFAGDHGIAAKGVSARSPEATRELRDALREGGTALAALAELAGTSVRVLDVAVDSEDDAEFRVRRASGSIDVEDALSTEETEQAVRTGMWAADAEIDEGADLLVAAELGVGATTPASTLVSALTGTEPVAVIGRGSGIDDHGWMRKAVAVRDALRRARPVVTEPLRLLATVGGADIAALAGFLAQAAARRTPVLLDGVCVCAAALMAEELAPGARAWWIAAHRTTEPAHDVALEHLDLDPVLDLGIAESGGCGAVAVLPLIRMAAALTESPGEPSLA